MTTILGIESTAHTFGIGVVKNGNVLANVREMYTTESGGIIPVESAKHHAKISFEVYESALEKAKIKEDEIDAVAFSNAPGLAPCLIEGMKFAKELVEKLNELHLQARGSIKKNKNKKIPIVSVNHCVAHLEIGKILGACDPVMLYASGANTQVVAYEAGKYRIFGETLDLGVGNFIDTVARFMGLGFPGGPKIEKLAKGGKYVELPYSVKGMDISLSGIQTNLKHKIEKLKHGIEKIPARSRSQMDLASKSTLSDFSAQSMVNRVTPEKNLSINSGKLRNIMMEFGVKQNKMSEISKRANYNLNDLAFSLQETVFAMLVETAERALAHVGKNELLLAGGVACNSRLQEMCRIMCEERGCKLFVPPRDLLVDNGAMIAFLGEIMFDVGIYGNDLKKIDIKPRERTDDVEVGWR